MLKKVDFCFRCGDAIEAISHPHDFGHVTVTAWRESEEWVLERHCFVCFKKKKWLKKVYIDTYHPV